MATPPVGRAVFLALLGTALMAGYFSINQRVVESPAPVEMPSWVPFFPVLAVPYLAVMVVPWFLPLFLRSRERFYACIASSLLAYAVIVAIWILYPTVMERPAVSADWWNWPYRLMVAIDRPANILPCGHILAPVIAAWFVGGERRNWLKVLVPLIPLAALAIVSTWQHRPFDVLTGCLIALAAIGCGEWGAGRWRRRRQGPPPVSEGPIP